MKKSTSIFALAAALGFSALAASPAMAVTGPYPNCAAAAAQGVYNIPAGAPGYSLQLDADHDGIACEAAGRPYVPAQGSTVTQVAPGQAAQVRQLPVGAASTGVAQKPNNGTEMLALGGGLVAIAAAAGTYVVRRRRAAQA